MFFKALRVCLRGNRSGCACPRLCGYGNRFPWDFSERSLEKSGVAEMRGRPAGAHMGRLNDGSDTAFRAFVGGVCLLGNFDGLTFLVAVITYAACAANIGPLSPNRTRIYCMDFLIL